MSVILDILANATPGKSPSVTEMIGLGNLLGTLIIGGFMTAMWRTRDRGDAAVAMLQQKLEDSQKSTHEITNKLVDERLRAATHSINNDVAAVKLNLQSFNDSLVRAEERLADASQIELRAKNQLLEAVAEIKECTVPAIQFTELKQTIERWRDDRVTKADFNQLKEEIRRGH